nr:helix-turn-helix transcriptional regulator [Winogradskyella sp.]
MLYLLYTLLCYFFSPYCYNQLLLFLFNQYFIFLFKSKFSQPFFLQLYFGNSNLFADICYVNKEQLKKKVGPRIVELRSQKGWSQSDLTRACNKDRQAIEKLENGKVNLIVYSLMEVSMALGITLRHFFKF